MVFNACDFPTFLSTSIFSIYFILIPYFYAFCVNFPREILVLLFGLNFIRSNEREMIEQGML